MKKIVSSTLLALLVMGISALAFTVQPVKADYTWNETIYIHGDGSIEPAEAPLSTVDNVTYTLTDNIVNAAPSSHSAIIIERDNIILNGAGHTLQGTDASSSIGIHLSGRSNVTVETLTIRNFDVGLALAGSSDNTVTGNFLLNNAYGVNLDDSSNLNTVAGNFLTDNTGGGVSLIGGSNLNTVAGNTMINSGFAVVGLVDSSNNTIADNTVFNSGSGVLLGRSSNNTVAGNTVINCAAGVALSLGSNLNMIAGNTLTYNMMAGVMLSEGSNLNTVASNTLTYNMMAGVMLQNSSSNTLYHNNFVYNTYQVVDLAWGDPEVPPSVNVWDAGYPSGGNYWSDYEDRYPEAMEIDDSGIWNAPYGIDADNQDNYPLMEPWSATPPTPPIPTTIAELRTEIEELGSEGQIDNQGVVRGLLAKLKVAQRLVDKGNLEEARSILEEDFIPQVQSLSGISMTVEAADRLIESAEYIIAHL